MKKIAGWCRLQGWKVDAASAWVAASLAGAACAHEVGGHAHDAPAATPLPVVVERKGPVKAPTPSHGNGAQVTGQGFWRFAAAPSALLPLPEETRPFLKGAHGTLVVDAPRDTVYWGLENVGWVAFGERLTKSSVVRGDPAFAKGNLHGADLMPRRGRLPLVAVADNVEGEVYLSDTAFQRADKLCVPNGEPYADRKGFAPTDTAFTSAGEVYVTDGYGRACFMPASVDPFAYRGVLHGGKAISQTPHGITYDPRDRSLLVSARPEAQVKRWSPKSGHWLEVQGLPAGSTVCDVDLWGDYALAPCLDGPGGSPGPIYIINLRTRAIVSTLRPKADLGFSEAQHIHDACWYFVGKGRHREVYVLFTHWNPGGIGALKLAATESE